MKKVLSGILVLVLTIALTMSAFAAAGDITVEEVMTTIGAEPESVVEPKTLKEDAADEEGMLRISSSALLKIKLKLESNDAEGKTMSFLANQKLAEDEAISKDKIQFVDEKTIAADGTVSIQFRPRLNQPVGIYNIRANTEGSSSMFGRFYKMVTDQIQPSLSEVSDTPKKKDIVLTVSGYTEQWKNATKLYEVEGDNKTEIPAADYSFETSEETPQIATLRIKTTSDWALQGQHTLRFVSTDIAYNPITFTANIAEPEKTVSAITPEFVSSTGNTIPDDLGGSITVQAMAEEGAVVTTAALAPAGYDISSVSYRTEDGESQNITASEGKYIFTMPDKAVKVTVTVTPKTYTLKLDLQGGAGIDNTTVTGTVEDLLQLPSDKPTLAGFDFANWRTEPNGGGNAVTNEHFNTIDKMLAFFGDSTEKTIYARWAEYGKFTVAYLAPESGVTNKPSDSNEYDKETTAQIVIPEQEPEREGYVFKGWKVDGDETIYKYGTDNAVYTSIASIQGSLRFNAQWEEIQTDDYEIISVDEENSSIKVIKRTDENAYIIVATYTEDGHIVKASIKDISDIKTTAAGKDIDVMGAFDGDYAKARVFMWNSLSDMQPRCAALPVNK